MTMTRRSLLKDLKVGQSLYIDGGRIVITLEHKSGQLARLRFVHDGASIESAPPVQEQRGRSGTAQAMLGIKAA